MKKNKTNSIVLGGGCFWCVEAIFRNIGEAKSVMPGYAGGDTENPIYEQVSTGKTGHTEVVKVEYECNKKALEKILMVFFKTHDPTTLNRQGGDVGTQYRSIILWQDEEQREVSMAYLEKIKDDFKKPIVTTIEKLDKFYPAEDYHVRYFEKNPDVAYSKGVIAPKVEKAKKLNK